LAAVGGAIFLLKIGAEISLGIRRPDTDSLSPSNWSVSGDFPCIRVKTDAEGRWHTTSLPADLADARSKTVLLLQVAHPRYVSDTGGFQRRLSLGTARAMTSVLVMKPGVTVSGQVRDSQGKPVPGARVVLAYSNNATDFLRTKTDATGGFDFPHVNEKPPLWRWVVNVETTGFAPAWKIASPHSKPQPLEFSLTPGRPFHARVLDRQGLPIAGVKVRAEWGQCEHLDWHAVTDTDGLFVWPDAPREGDIRLELHKHKYGLQFLKVSAKSDRTHLTFDPD